MNKLLKKATSTIDNIPAGKFENYNLTENPFPSQPILNKDSTEKKFNGSIYEPEIRTAEYDKILNSFIRVAQNDVSHLRLGFILDSSYIGRGNGKTAFLLNLIKKINEDFSLDLSNGLNKCFGIYFQPEAGGKTKTFDSFVDIFFQAILDSNLINYSLAILRLESIISLKENIMEKLGTEGEIVQKLNDEKWFQNEGHELLNGISKREITIEIFKNQFLQGISSEFPLYRDAKLILSSVITEVDFREYYSSLKKGAPRFNFIFSELVSLFLAAGFNGAYIFIDDFERIPDHQSAIQKKDFVSQLRTVLYDGLYLNSKIGFFNFIFALHAGVPRILQDAWGLAGLEHRVSLNPAVENPKHMILFDRISEKHAVLLIEKYLSEFRIKSLQSNDDKLIPFTQEAIKLIGIKSELNAAKILQASNNIIEHAADSNVQIITKEYVEELTKQSGINVEQDKTPETISTTENLDLLSKAKKERLIMKYVLNLNNQNDFITAVFENRQDLPEDLEELINGCKFFYSEIHGNMYFLAKTINQKIKKKDNLNSYFLQAIELTEEGNFFLEPFGSDFIDYILKENVSDTRISLDDEVCDMLENYLERYD